MKNIIGNNPKPDGDNNTVELLFRTDFGECEYNIEALEPSPPPARILKLKSTDPAQPAVLRLLPPTANQGAHPTSLFFGPGGQACLLWFGSEIDRFECQDLVLDGNWSGWANWGATQYSTNATSPAYMDGFRLSALYAKAKRGLIRKVRVKNCGANGLVPQPYWVGYGAEAFPLSVRASAFMPDGTNSGPAWVVEDCEVSDFHSVRGGYCTAIMVCTPYWQTSTNGPDPGICPNLRVAEVRRCLVRGSGAEIAFGSAQSAGVSFHDNVAVGVALGLNHDTGPVRNVDVTNSIFLDVPLLANVGGANCPTSYFTNYTVSWNAARMRHVPLHQLYTDYEWRTNVVGAFTNVLPVSDASLALGRFKTSYCAGLRLGGADNIAFQTNRFTTRPLTNFFEPDPAKTNLANWRPLYCPTIDPETGRGVTLGSNLTTNGNTLSSLAFDFTTLTNIAMPAVERPPLPTGPAGFSPSGFPGRVLLATNAQGQLLGVYEISVGQPVLVGGQVQVKARYLYHPSSLGGSGETSEQPPPDDLHLCVRAGPNKDA